MANTDAIWVTEALVNQESHQISLILPAAQGSISHGFPLISGFDERFETNHVGGHGLVYDKLIDRSGRQENPWIMKVTKMHTS